MGQVLLTVYGSAGQEGTNNGPQHGGPPAYSLAPPPEGTSTLRLARVRHPVPYGVGGLRKQGLEGRGPWQYVACLPGQRQIGDPFDTPEEVPTSKEKGKRPMELEGEKNLMQNPKRPNKAVCRLFNLAPRGCPYGRECIFVHRCTNCGAVDDHGRLACPTLQGPSTGPKPDGGLQREFHSPSPRR